MRAKEVLITSESPLPIEMDGEYAGETPVSYRVIPGAIQLELFDG